MNSFDQFFYQRLLARVATLRQEKLESLLTRHEPGDYLHKIGYIAALTDIAEISEEILHEMNTAEA